MDLDRDSCYRAVCLRDTRFDGRFFTGVKTTGVYCRPVCPAPTPRLRNVSFYATAAAAQAAGFRPCLRCRPETAPDLGAWRGTSNTVARALGLIELGALDDGDVEGLAGRLGMGARQLRRLFRKHLGATPVAVAQTRRVLLAKQLIHDTGLPMAEVAFAAGFGSIRRFNETFLALFGCAPVELRRQGAPETGARGDISLLLRFQPPYDWPAMLDFFARRAIAGVECVTPGSYTRSVETGSVQAIVSVRPEGEDAVMVTVRSTEVSILPAVVGRIRRMFDLAADPAAIAAQLAKDPALARLVNARPGLRIPGGWDGFEVAVRAILGQQITVAAAARLGARLVAAFGKPLVRPAGELTHVFPTAEVLAAADLTGIGMPRSRAAAISALSAGAIADPRLFDVTYDLDEAVRRLRSIKGIGEWTAQYIALRQMREPDAFPAADAGLRRAIAKLIGRELPLPEFLDRAHAWRPWRAYAAQHLWAAG